MLLRVIFHLQSHIGSVYSPSRLYPPTTEEVTQLEDRTLISFIHPAQKKELVQQLHDQKSTAFAMDCIPRTLSRGQMYDASAGWSGIFDGWHGFMG